jgi:hypothetical protein
MASSTKTAWLQADRRQTKEISFGYTPSKLKKFKSFLTIPMHGTSSKLLNVLWL